MFSHIRFKLLIVVSLLLPLYSQTAVTYTQGGGRLGDKLIEYIHAKWIAFQNNIPLVYHPFPYSENFVFSQQEIHLAEAAQSIHPLDLYICPYFPESAYEIQRQPHWKRHFFQVDFDNQIFLQELRAMLSPLCPIKSISPPKDGLSLALHIREGGGFDANNLTCICPEKSPPFCFYLASLHEVLRITEGRAIYCHVFTDAKDPALLIENLKKSLPPHCPISFHYRSEGNAHDKNVLDDFFSFQNFDILIRPDSNFSIVPSLIYPFAMICSPLDFWFDEKQYPHTKAIQVQIKDLDRLLHPQVSIN